MDEINKNNQELYNRTNNTKHNDTNISNENINNNDENKESNEKTPLKKNERLIKILNDMSNKLNSNKYREIEEIYEDYDGNDDDKKVIKRGYSKLYIILWFIFFGLFFLIINSVGIFTIRSVINSLFEIWKFSIKCFFYKQSDLSKYNLTDFASRFNSSYNFYEQYFNDIYNNNVDFDLIMFWDFIGSLMCKYCGFNYTFIFFFY